MLDTPLPFVPKMLLECASSINSDPLIPLHVPPATVAFLHHLGNQCDHSTKPLGRFLAPVSRSQLAEAIIKVALPSEVTAMRAEAERLQRKKEEAIACQEWESARALRDKQYLLEAQLRELAKNTIDVQPCHITKALSDLGFDKPITE
jgi:hypothetical protein